MSKFYDEIALYYDDIFPVQEAKLNRILEQLPSIPSDILDVACATGGYAIELASLGHQLTAVDLDARMIQELKDKNTGIDARVMNMLDIDSLNKTFDLIYCFGNSIVHLDTIADVKAFFLSCYQTLKPDGQFLFQVINYDRILDQHIDHLPTIHNANTKLSFIRNYSYLQDEHKIAFHTILQVDDHIRENTVKLLPIRHEELIEALTEAGFQAIKTYGGFMKQAFDAQKSVPCVMIAKK
jgi:SAM-dependent methyltransferase